MIFFEKDFNLFGSLFYFKRSESVFDRDSKEFLRNLVIVKQFLLLQQLAVESQHAWAILSPDDFASYLIFLPVCYHYKIRDDDEDDFHTLFANALLFLRHPTYSNVG